MCVYVYAMRVCDTRVCARVCVRVICTCDVCICELTCAGVTLCLVAISLMTGSSNTFGSPSSLKGLPGLPSGEYASSTMPAGDVQDTLRQWSCSQALSRRGGLRQRPRNCGQATSTPPPPRYSLRLTHLYCPGTPSVLAAGGRDDTPLGSQLARSWPSGAVALSL